MTSVSAKIPSRAKSTVARAEPISRNTSELARNAANSQNSSTNARPCGVNEMPNRCFSVRTPRLPNVMPAATLASTPEAPKCSAIKNEPKAATAVTAVSTR